MNKKAEIKRLIVDKLLQEPQITRTGIIQEHHLRPATVFGAVTELIDEGLLLEPDRKYKKTGRSSPEIQLNSDYAYHIGIELKVDRIFGVIIDSSGETVTRIEESFHRRITRSEVLQLLDGLIKSLRGSFPHSWEKIVSIGFADPGLVDIAGGISLRAVNLPGWQNIDMRKTLQDLVKLDNILVMPETSCRTFMEYYSRRDNPPKSLLHINLGIGIGSGFIKNGEIFVGDTGHGMELGHIMIIPDGPVCQCGNHGCLEAVAGEAAIKRNIEELLNNGVVTELSLEDFSLKKFAETATRDRAAMMLADKISESVSLALATAITLLNPSCVVISGELVQLGELLLSAVKRTLSMHCFPGAIKELSLETSQLDDFAAAEGVAILARNRILSASVVRITQN